MKVRPYLVLLSFLVAIVTVSFAQLPKTVSKDACAKCHASERRTHRGHAA